MSTHAQAAEAYLTSSVENAPPIKIVRMLYQGALKFLLQAEGEDPLDPTSGFIQFCGDADAIVAELRLSLRDDVGGEEVVEQLKGLYLFCEGEIARAMLERDRAPLPNVRQVLSKLLEAWQHVEVESLKAAA
ncbi:MAG: flagellar export chaperone FliS [Planctomycetota bacterium]